MVELVMKDHERANILNNKHFQIYVFFKTIILILEKKQRFMNWHNGIQERENVVKLLSTQLLKLSFNKLASFAVLCEDHNTGFSSPTATVYLCDLWADWLGTQDFSFPVQEEKSWDFILRSIELQYSLEVLKQSVNKG